LVPAAFVFDVFDGRIARWRRQNSALGARARLARRRDQLRRRAGGAGFGAGLDGFWDCLVLVYFVACGVSRLARYNITAEALATDASGKVKYFEGHADPDQRAAGGPARAGGLAGRGGRRDLGRHAPGGPWEFHPLVLLYLLSGSLMISKTLRIPKL
jgi:CDP-diacylglycerol--serine O-phosphatidyltransferase